MMIHTLEEYSSLKSDTHFTFICVSCGKEFDKRKRRGTRGARFNFLCQTCGREKTNIERYGAKNVFASEEIKDKIKDVLIEKYGVDNSMKLDETKEKIKQTCLEKYGVEYSFQSENNKEKTKKTLIERYGVDHPSKNEEIRAKMRTSWYESMDETMGKIRQTSLEKYGVPHPMQNHEIQLKSKKKYTYENIQFDSSWELALYIYCKDNNIDCEYHPNICFRYVYNDKEHLYFPDFRIENEYIEIKGLQFFENKDDTKRMINPFDRSLDDKFEAKHQCMIQNNVRIITDCTKYLKYVKEKYSTDFLKLYENK